jgi:hypothetical protein
MAHRKLKRDAVRKAKRRIAKVQRKFYGPPSRRRIKKIVNRVMRRYGLKKTNVAKYFRLWATCALMNFDALCRNWRKPTDKEIEES